MIGADTCADDSANGALIKYADHISNLSISPVSNGKVRTMACRYHAFETSAIARIIQKTRAHCTYIESVPVAPTGLWGRLGSPH